MIIKELRMDVRFISNGSTLSQNQETSQDEVPGFFLKRDYRIDFSHNQ